MRNEPIDISKRNTTTPIISDPRFSSRRKKNTNVQDDYTGSGYETDLDIKDDSDLEDLENRDPSSITHNKSDPKKLAGSSKTAEK